MITKGSWVDGSKATFYKSFTRNKDWLSAANEASIWLLEIIEREFVGQQIFVFLSDTIPQNDNKINRYRKFSKRPFVKELIADGCIVVEEKLSEAKCGLYFWSLLTVSNVSVPKLIDYLRSDRGSFLFISNRETVLEDLFSNIISSRIYGSLERIDQPHVIQGLIKHQANPIRIWGQFDDKELWVEVYSN